MNGPRSGTRTGRRGKARKAATPAGRVRIIGGRWRGTRLEVPASTGLRPSSNRVRETLFNWLQPVLPGMRVLDLFAGSGALGLEALSRGAREAYLVERDPQLAERLRAVVERLHAEDQAQVLRADALDFLQAPLHGRFDLVLLDPPFTADMWATALQRLPPWLSADAWLYLEQPAVRPRQAPVGWQLHRQGHTRDVHYALYRHAGGADTLPPAQGQGSANNA